MAIDFDTFGPYTVYECLGTGGMATVHRAMFDDGETVREVALKRLLPQHLDDKTFVEDFVREGKLAARLSHPSIVRIVEQGKIDRTYFIAMELVPGRALMQLIRTAHFAKTLTPIGVVIALISELCGALDYAHNGIDPETGERFNIVHRDLSPSNLLITEDGHLKVIDFGVAKTTAGKFTTQTGLVKGKLGYMSVEALAGKQIDGRSDVFSVGVVAWELITGQRLFTGKSEIEVIQRVREGVVAPPSMHNPQCPPTLDSIVERALARNRDDRWPTAGAMRQAIEVLRRAYREDATPEQVVTWCAAIAPVEPGSDAEQTRALPAMGKVKRSATVLDLVDDELSMTMAEGSSPREVPGFSEEDAAEGTFSDMAAFADLLGPTHETAEMTAQTEPAPVTSVSAAMTIESPAFSDDVLDLVEPPPPASPPPGPATQEMPALLDLEAIDPPTVELTQTDTVVQKRGG